VTSHFLLQFHIPNKCHKFSTDFYVCDDFAVFWPNMMRFNKKIVHFYEQFVHTVLTETFLASNHWFSKIVLNEIVLDRAVVTVKHYIELVSDLSNDMIPVTSSDLEWGMSDLEGQSATESFGDNRGT